jgi:hypothetical protein
MDEHLAAPAAVAVTSGPGLATCHRFDTTGPPVTVNGTGTRPLPPA